MNLGPRSHVYLLMLCVCLLLSPRIGIITSGTSNHINNSASNEGERGGVCSYQLVCVWAGVVDLDLACLASSAPKWGVLGCKGARNLFPSPAKERKILSSQLVHSSSAIPPNSNLPLSLGILPECSGCSAV